MAVSFEDLSFTLECRLSTRQTLYLPDLQTEAAFNADDSFSLRFTAFWGVSVKSCRLEVVAYANNHCLTTFVEDKDMYLGEGELDRFGGGTQTCSEVELTAEQVQKVLDELNAQLAEKAPTETAEVG